MCNLIIDNIAVFKVYFNHKYGLLVILYVKYNISDVLCSTYKVMIQYFKSQ